ncbi:MAG: SRPBCC family protein [bacterium]|nr:SRPBCC family protein [bacterium]
MAPRPTVVSSSERLIAVDPTQVWALLANPDRLSEWSGLTMVGYMGTELPKPGHVVFVQRRRVGAKPKRLEVESWEAGAGIRCLVHTTDQATRFELAIRPQIEPSSISTRVRLTQRSAVPSFVQGAAAWWMARRLDRMLDRIARAVQS